MQKLAFLLLASALLSSAPAPQGSVEHVVHISIDGLNALLLEQLLANDPAGDFVNLQRFVDEGATTLNARADYDLTKTLPNHVTMVTGRPVLQPAGQPNTTHHGWFQNDDPEPNETLHNAGNPNLDYIASTFDVAHDHGLSVALFVSKDKLVLFERSYDADSGAPDTVGADDGTDKIDLYREEILIHPVFLAEMALQQFDYAFLHYRDPDSAGHASGWGSAGWNDAVRLVDDWLGELFLLVEGEPGLAGATAIVLTGDHGGTGTSHADSTQPDNYTVPFFVWGPGVAPGTDLYTLTAGRRADPGAGRPDYDAPIQPIRNGDGANLALELLGLPPVPGSTINAAQDLEVGYASATSPYGCGVNPAGSLTELGGTPAVGTTFVLGIDNPLGTQAPGSIPFVLVSTAPDPAFPCGTILAGLGMAGDGELLVSLAPADWIQPALAGPPWLGAGQPAAVSIPVPNNPLLAGRDFYFQGLLFDLTRPIGARIGLTTALEVRIGSSTP